ncbi:hypothetical protein [Aeromonas caviae]|uniref:hypothetical protein n=1 Tax=Aeromonas caviae TaxID=648 RepID=UPI00224DAFAB|nr:hypothetical protein [Aeromonas caviae]MCX4071943.1 hypothetical protein [Aeromonas caviae]
MNHKMLLNLRQQRADGKITPQVYDSVFRELIKWNKIESCKLDRKHKLSQRADEWHDKCEALGIYRYRW